MSKHGHEAKAILSLLALGLLTAQAWGVDLKRNFSADVGLGFDWVGQRYRLSDQDTLDQFDEESLSASVAYGGILKDGLWVEEGITLSDHNVKNLLITAWSTAPAGDGLFRLENQLELKNYWWRGRDLFSSGYLENRLRMEGKWLFEPDLSFGGDQRLSYMNYEKNSSYFRDYWLSESTVSLEADLGWMWDLILDYSFAVREVPDTSGMNYLSHSLTTSLNGLIGWALQLRMEGQVERRLSREQDRRQDYLNLATQGELEYELGPKTGLVFRGELERMTYDHPDEIYYDFWTGTGWVGVSREIASFTRVALLPTYGGSQAKGTSIGETYRQLGIELELDYSGMGRLWADLAIELGARDYQKAEEEEDFYSSYSYCHPTILLSYRLTHEISFDLFADYDPEWHKQREDNFTTNLVTCSLSYRIQ